MTTAFCTGPGFFSVKTSKSDPSIPPNVMRIFTARIEAYDYPETSPDFQESVFTVLPAKADGRPEIAKALLELGNVIQANREILMVYARGGRS